MTPSGEPPERISCPTCRRPVESKTSTFPFCSARCRDIDLGNWFEEKYRIPTSITEEDELLEEEREGDEKKEDGDEEATGSV